MFKMAVKKLAKRYGLNESVPVIPHQPQLDRKSIANIFLSGEGIEVGALHNPLALPPGVKVKYIDRLSVDDLRKHYPELSQHTLVPLDILADGERLETVTEASQDFAIANHFIEHCRNPFLALKNFLRVLKPKGVLYLAVPDKRHTFDKDRPITPVEHLLRDFEEGPDWSREAHFEEWVRSVYKVQGEDAVRESKTSLMSMDYSIHYHVWTTLDFFETLTWFQRKVEPGFNVELFLQHEDEMIFIIRKK